MIEVTPKAEGTYAYFVSLALDLLVVRTIIVWPGWPGRVCCVAEYMRTSKQAMSGTAAMAALR